MIAILRLCEGAGRHVLRSVEVWEGAPRLDARPADGGQLLERAGHV
jgi:hypothetical protein